MKLSLITKTSAIALTLTAASAVHAMDAEALFDQTSPSIWVVHAYDAQGKPFSLGTAVVIDTGRLITNCHVLARASSFKVQRLNVVLPGSLEFPDIERDLCQIKVSNLVAPAVKIAPIDRLRVGQKVFAIGAPQGLEETMSDGLLSALRLDKEGKLRYIQTSAPVSHGSSGGGLFNDKGELIGITTLGIEGSVAQNISFAVPAQWIQEVPERGKAAIAKSRSGNPPPAASAPATATAPATTPPVARAPQAPPAQPPAQSRALPPAPTASAPAGTSEKWNGLMSCDARSDNGDNSAAYQARFSMEINGATVNVYRRNNLVVETLTGNISNNTLDLRGIGYRANNPGLLWQFRFSGQFSAGSSVFSGKGNMLRDGTPIRACDLIMTRI
ncbi:S1C family serine protease [Herbaspirillum rhizosphaerae]|uniref:S1C family serine protease n=1 Tax=Herbaspirillum rhizosphaerae TaxID=346179 RepID=UPI00067E4545|nr:S1C family serine protease [Herbaspirillum rhizosphaerae]